MLYKVTNEIDYLVAQAQNELRVAVDVVRDAREQGDYHKEKASGKMAAFLEKEYALCKAYAELKAYYPDIAEMLEKRKTYLAEMQKNAKTLFDQNLKDDYSS